MCVPIVTVSLLFFMKSLVGSSFKICCCFFFFLVFFFFFFFFFFSNFRTSITNNNKVIKLSKYFKVNIVTSD